MCVCTLGQKDPLEQEMATHSRILPGKIPWIEEPGGLQSIGSQRVRHDLSVHACTLDCLPGEFLFLFHVYFGLEILDPEIKTE